MEGHPGLRESSSGSSARAASDTRDMPKDIATQMVGILALASSEDYRPPFGKSITKRGHGGRPLLVGSNEPRGEKQYAFRGV